MLPRSKGLPSRPSSDLCFKTNSEPTSSLMQPSPSSGPLSSNSLRRAGCGSRSRRRRSSILLPGMLRLNTSSRRISTRSSFPTSSTTSPRRPLDTSTPPSLKPDQQRTTSSKRRPSTTTPTETLLPSSKPLMTTLSRFGARRSALDQSSTTKLDSARLPNSSEGKATSISLVEPIGDEEEERFWDCLEDVDEYGLEAKTMDDFFKEAKRIFEAEGFWTPRSAGKTGGRKEGSHLTEEDGLSRLIRHLISGAQDKNGRRGIDEQDFKLTKASRDISVKLIRAQARPWKDRFGRDRLLIKSYITGAPTFSVPVDWDPSCKEMRAFAPTIKASIDHIFQITAAWMLDEELQKTVVKLTMNGPYNLGFVTPSEQDSKHRFPLGCYLILLHLVFLFRLNPNYIGSNSEDDTRVRLIAVRLVELFNVAYEAWGVACPIKDRFAQGLGSLVDARAADDLLREMTGMSAFNDPFTLAKELGITADQLEEIVQEEDAKNDAKNDLPSASKKQKLEVRPGKTLYTPSAKEDQLKIDVRTVCQGINDKLRLRGFEYELTEDGVLSFDGTRNPAAERLARMCLNASQVHAADTPGRSDEALSEQERYKVYGNNALVVLGEWMYGHADDLEKARQFDPQNPVKIWFSDSKIRTLFFAVYSKSALLHSTARRDHVVAEGIQSHRTRYPDPKNATISDIIDGGDPALSNLEPVTWFTNAADGRGSAEQTRERREKFISDVAGPSTLGLSESSRCGFSRRTSCSGRPSRRSTMLSWRRWCRGRLLEGTSRVVG